MHIRRHLRLALATTLGFFVLFIIGFLAWFTVLDQEWYNNQVLGYVRNISSKIYQYKKVNNRVPDNLGQIEMSDKYCALFFRCFKIIYKPSADLVSFTIVSKIADTEPSLVIADGADCTIDYKYSYICGTFSYSANYQGQSFSFPVYLKDKVYLGKRYFATPSAWPTEGELKN